MTGNTQPDTASEQALWDAVAEEREAGTPPSTQGTAPEGDADDVTNLQTEAGEQPAEAQTNTQEDPFAGLSPAVRERLDRMSALEAQVAQIPQLFQHVKTAEGRVAAMQREMDQARAAAKAVGSGPSAAQIKAAQGDTRKWDELKGDFPDWAEATEQFVKASLAGISQQQISGLDPNQVEQLVEQRLAGHTEKVTRAIEEAKVEGKYGDWKSVVNTPQFVDWYGKQGPDIRALGASTVGRDAIRLLDTFHQAIAKPADVVQQSRSNKLQAAVNARPGTVAATAKTPDQMSPTELWEYERKRAAKRNNSLSY